MHVRHPLYPDTIIDFHETETNIGNGMDSSTGIFTAPVSGTYFFSFSGEISPHPLDPLIDQNVVLRVVCQNNESKTIDLNDIMGLDPHTVSYMWTMSLDQSDEIFLKFPNDELSSGEFHGQFVMTQWKIKIKPPLIISFISSIDFLLSQLTPLANGNVALIALILWKVSTFFL